MQQLAEQSVSTSPDFLPLNGTDHVEFYVGNARQAAYYYRAAFGNPFSFLVSNRSTTIISAPTLLIWGGQDIALGIELTQGLEQWVPNLLVRHISDSGHWVQQEKPEMVNEALLEFLRATL